MTLAVSGVWDRFITGRQSAASGIAGRVDFVDYGKGLCIILVVMMHSTLGVGTAMGGTGWMHVAVDFSRPFRMPDFFLIAGLFLSRTIDAPWRRYLDRKVLHFAYFYVLWTLIHTAVKIPVLPDASPLGLLTELGWRMIDPGTPLWFIYMLPIFFVVTRLLKNVPWPLVMAAAAVMEAFHASSASMVAYAFTFYFVYFYAGYRFAPLVFAFANHVAVRPMLTLAGLLVWGVVNALVVFAFSVNGQPLAQFPGIGLILGFAGAFAIVAIAALLAEFGLLRFLSWLGQRSIIVFVAFVLFMGPTRIVLVKLGLVQDIGTVSLLVMLAALAGPLLMAMALAPTPLKYLFKRPDWAKLKNTG